MSESMKGCTQWAVTTVSSWVAEEPLPPFVDLRVRVEREREREREGFGCRMSESKRGH